MAAAEQALSSEETRIFARLRLVTVSGHHQTMSSLARKLMEVGLALKNVCSAANKNTMTIDPQRHLTK